jgi:hypothetical protein
MRGLSPFYVSLTVFVFMRQCCKAPKSAEALFGLVWDGIAVDNQQIDAAVDNQ